VVSPREVAPNATATLRVDTSLLCGNDRGNDPRSNDWIAELTLVTDRGTFRLATSDRLRAENP
jgi:hypothetical protein